VSSIPQLRLRIAGTAVDDEQDRIRAIVAADRDPLIDPADVNERRFVDRPSCACCYEREGDDNALHLLEDPRHVGSVDPETRRDTASPDRDGYSSRTDRFLDGETRHVGCDSG
jgi:hypothetical protein